MNRRVVVTGIGVITPVGNDVRTYWNSLLDGVCGIDFVKAFSTDDLPVKIAGEVKDFNPADYGIEPGFARKQDKFTVYAVAAAWQAVQQSGISSAEDGNIDPFRFGVYVGSGIGGFTTMVRETEKILTEGRKQVREEAKAAAAPKQAMTCPWCGATTTPDASGCCEYCGGAV